MTAQLRSVLLLIATLALVGCGTAPQSSLIQQAMDRLIPTGFAGSTFSGGYKIPMYLSIQIQIEGLARTPAGWTFTYAEYTRDGPAMSYAHFALGKRL